MIQESFSRERGAILVGRDAVAEIHAVRRRVQVPARVPHAAALRPRHRLVLLLLPGRHRAHPERRALRRRLAALRHPPRRHGQQLRAQGRQRRADPRPRGPAGGVRRAQRARPGRAGRRGGARAPQRQDPGDGVAADASTPTSWPATTSTRWRRTTRSSTRTRPSPSSTGRSRPRCPPGLDVQAGHRRGGARERQLHRRRPTCPAARRSSFPSPPRRSATAAAPAAPTGSRSSRRSSSPATPRSSRWPTSSATRR